MLIATLTSLFLLRTLNQDSSAIWAGLFATLAALTRASFSYLAIPTAAYLVWARGWRVAAVFLLPAVILQGAWTAKNYVAYGYVDIATSSWKGVNALIGYWFVPGGFDAFKAHVAAKGDRYPEWFVRMTEKHGPVTWWSPILGDYVPEEYRKRDAEVQAALGGTARTQNSMSLRHLSDVYMKVVPEFAVANPGLTLRKFWAGYCSFWRPIEDYSNLYMGPIYTDPRGRDLLHPFAEPKKRVARLLVGTYEFGMEKRDTLQTDLTQLTSLYIVDTICLVIVHTLLPLFLAVFSVRLFLRTSGLDEIAIFGAALPFLYGIVLFNLVEVGENVRYRLAVEPIMLAICVGLPLFFARLAFTFFQKASDEQRCNLSDAKARDSGERQPSKVA
jgi:hypothetical protein